MFRHRALLISVNRSATETSLLDATRYAWKISKPKAKQAEVILATLQGLIVGAFVADDWLDATAANFPGREDVPGRLGLLDGRQLQKSQRCMWVSACLMNTVSVALQIRSSTPGVGSG